MVHIKGLTFDLEFVTPAELKQGNLAHGEGAYLEFAPRAPAELDSCYPSRSAVLGAILAPGAALDQYDNKGQAFESLEFEASIVAMRDDGATTRVSSWNMYGYMSDGHDHFRVEPGRMRVQFQRNVDLRELMPATEELVPGVVAPSSLIDEYGYFRDDDDGPCRGRGCCCRATCRNHFSFVLDVDVNEENLSMSLGLCSRSFSPSGGFLYPVSRPTLARAIHVLLDQGQPAG
jgi:hypothetical protein